MLQQRTHKLRRQFAAALPSGLVLLVLGCPTTPPATHGSQTNQVSTAGEEAVGSQGSPPPGFTSPPVQVSPSAGPKSPSPGPSSVVPSGLFPVSTPTPSVQPTPALEPIYLALDLGPDTPSSSASQFIIPFTTDLPHLDPPGERIYRAVVHLGIGPRAASPSFSVSTSPATASARANWHIDGVVTDHSFVASGSVPPPKLPIFFILSDGSTSDTALATEGVRVAVATLSVGTLLTFEATISATNSDPIAFDWTGPSLSPAVQVYASNEGVATYTISSLRVPHWARGLF